jgi:hypothetical protein
VVGPRDNCPPLRLFPRTFVVDMMLSLFIALCRVSHHVSVPKGGQAAKRKTKVRRVARWLMERVSRGRGTYIVVM